MMTMMMMMMMIDRDEMTACVFFLRLLLLAHQALAERDSVLILTYLLLT